MFFVKCKDLKRTTDSFWKSERIFFIFYLHFCTTVRGYQTQREENTGEYLSRHWKLLEKYVRDHWITMLDSLEIAGVIAREQVAEFLRYVFGVSVSLSKTKPDAN